MILLSVYKSNNSNELDLHGLHIAEVNVILSEYLRRKLDELKKTPGKRKLYVDIITGYGATKGVQGRIKPTVIQYLKQKNFTYEKLNVSFHYFI
jgi:DNA-nicking Smr family endonuclease